MSSTELFGKWTYFHLLMSGEKLDVYNFKIKNYGLSKQLVIEAVILCHVEKVSKVLHAFNEATLVIQPPGHEAQYFHGALVYDCSNLCNPPKDYLAFDIKLETPFWHLTHTYSCSSYHRTDASEFLEHVIEASGIDESRFILGILPKEKKALRFANQTRWKDFISKELALEKVYSRSSFDKDNETILFSSYLPEFAKTTKPRRLAIRLAEHMRRDVPNLFYNKVKEYKQVGLKNYSNTKIKCFETIAYPGELIQIGNSDFFVENIEISGSHSFRFDSSNVVQDDEPTLISELNLIPVSEGLDLEVKPEVDRGFSVFTGELEADVFGEEHVTREYGGTYNGRYDFDEEITEVENESEPLGPMRTESLQDLRLASLMAGYGHGVDLPLHDGTEVLFTRPNDSSEPALVLGTLNNQRSGNLTTRANRDENIIRTWSGNQLKMIDSHQRQTLALETAKAQNSLNFDYQSGAVKLSSQQGKVEFEAATDYIIHTPATIILQAENNAKKIINNNFEADVFEGTINIETKGSTYLTSVEDYNIEVRKVMVESKNHIIFEAQESIDITVEELQLLVDNGDIEISSDNIIINANELIATSAGASLKITEGLLDLRAKDKAIIDIEQAAHVANEHNLGGKPKQPIKNKVETIKEKKEAELDPEQDDSFEIEKSKTKTVESENSCWHNINKGELIIDISGKMKGSTKRSLLATLQNKKSLQEKLDELIIKEVADKTTFELNQKGELNLSTELESLKGESFSIKLGVDPQTLLPYAAASISYDFYNYKLKTLHGDLTIKGTITFKNTFTPMVPNGSCQAWLPFEKGIIKPKEALQFANDNKEAVVSILLTGGAIGLTAKALGVVGTQAAVLATKAAAGGALLGATTLSYAEEPSSYDLHHELPVQSIDQTITVVFSAYNIEREN